MTTMKDAVCIYCNTHGHPKQLARHMDTHTGEPPTVPPMPPLYGSEKERAAEQRRRKRLNDAQRYEEAMQYHRSLGLSVSSSEDVEVMLKGE